MTCGGVADPRLAVADETPRGPVRSTRTNGFRDAPAALRRAGAPPAGGTGRWAFCGVATAGGSGAAVCRCPGWDVARTGAAGGWVPTWGRAGGGGAHPQFQFHVHVLPLIADCGDDAPPGPQSVAFQFQFQIHVTGSVPGAEGVTDTPVPVGAVVPSVAVPNGPETVLVCVTGPSLPGLLTRITTFRFVGTA